MKKQLTIVALSIAFALALLPACENNDEPKIGPEGDTVTPTFPVIDKKKTDCQGTVDANGQCQEAGSGNTGGDGGPTGGTGGGNGVSGTPGGGNETPPSINVELHRCGLSDPSCQPMIDGQDKVVGALKLTWELIGIQSAFVQLPTQDDPGVGTQDQFLNPFNYMPFLGSTTAPYMGRTKYNPDDLLDHPLKDWDSYMPFVKNRILGDAEALPFNYCVAAASSIASALAQTENRLCYSSPQTNEANYLNIFFPLRRGETTRRGTWLLNARDTSKIIVYYKEFASTVVKTILLTQPASISSQ
ncbi:MAG: hypothetical protein HYS22_07885 [Deltaproteobacteria bacterium]|nr:hypothetical protein [Deltaproteobacteria bacterium]